ncbi:hypothetical protein PR048_004668 [Dryococelus australis]|uniref:Uncharacterized protein n=1 Tax=Dryococelus australis TaxID=614101 RepID=A0ABQ9I722_9NEOP|nr:hypothetical protein PR048_004668 [Dryococelus australis]
MWNDCLRGDYFVRNEKSNKRRWTREMLAEGPQFGNTLFLKLKVEDSVVFRNFTRLTPSGFEELLQVVGGMIFKQNTRFRETILAILRLAVTLCFLASGDSFTCPMYSFRILKQSV